ncbi:2-amino-4-hydroxy-6-hydroxymethyldihydropteridine diphosphokinase [Proteiniphilum sp. UBA5510]|uniref:2-amino-4-hydroxy-6- hydroxymethyldihydropteridine diphosphokinase n=1 Tax=Proteiniphilum sp. UBA5510 TaxID=1947286 RepID=UPI0039C91D09
MMAFSIILALGSNLGDKRQNIALALGKIEERIGRITSLSALYDTIPAGFFSKQNFINCVCEVDTYLNVYDIFASTQEIEKEMGRTIKSREGKYTDRIIDIDLIMAGDLIIHTPDLTIPHPLFHTRDFVLTPLCEITPDKVHPILGKTIRQLKEELDQKRNYSH